MDNFSDNNNNFNNNFNDDSIYESENAAPNHSDASNPNVFAGFAKFFGIFSIFCSFFSISLIALICGGLAIILAVLSKGYEIKTDRNARVGMIAGILSITLQIIILGTGIYNFLYVPEYRELFNTLYEQNYGKTPEQAIEEWLDPSVF